MKSFVTVALAFVVGATVIELAQSQYTAPAIGAVTGGLASLLLAMRGQSAPAQGQQKPAAG